MPVPSPAPEIVRTKVVATLGPASRSEEAIRGLVEAGVDVFRLNMAHGSVPEHQESLDRIRRVSESLARPLGVLADHAGRRARRVQRHAPDVARPYDARVLERQ